MEEKITPTELVFCKGLQQLHQKCVKWMLQMPLERGWKSLRSWYTCDVILRLDNGQWSEIRMHKFRYGSNGPDLRKTKMIRSPLHATELKRVMRRVEILIF